VRTQGNLHVPFAYVLKHLERWGLLGKEVLLQDLAPVLVFAKQDITDPYRCAQRNKACWSKLSEDSYQPNCTCRGDHRGVQSIIPYTI
jgi:hypothetical protein